jgi:hypothetical protein
MVRTSPFFEGQWLPMRAIVTGKVDRNRRRGMVRAWLAFRCTDRGHTGPAPVRCRPRGVQYNCLNSIDFI